MPPSDTTNYSLPITNYGTSSCDSDCKEQEFNNQLDLAAKILYILISMLIILGNTLVLLVTWREREVFINQINISLLVWLSLIF